MLLHGRCGGYSTNGLDPVPRIVHLKYLSTVYAYIKGGSGLWPEKRPPLHSISTLAPTEKPSLSPERHSSPGLLGDGMAVLFRVV